MYVLQCTFISSKYFLPSRGKSQWRRRQFTTDVNTAPRCKIRTPDTHKPRATLLCAVAPHIFESWVRNYLRVQISKPRNFSALATRPKLSFEYVKYSNSDEHEWHLEFLVRYLLKTWRDATFCFPISRRMNMNSPGYFECKMPRGQSWY
jgi:hypothetical protein